MDILFSQISKLAFVFFISISILICYKLQLAETNSYLGYINFEVDLEYLISAATGLIITYSVLPSKISKPSHFLFLLYGIFVLLPYATLYPIRLSISYQSFLLHFLCLSIPLVIVKFVCHIIPRINYPAIINLEYSIRILIFFCLIGVLFASINSPFSASFDFESLYERRIEARDIYVAGTLLAYINSAIVNGVAPFLGFISGWKKDKKLLLFSFACGLIYFFLIGIKSTLIFIILGFIIGRAVRLNKINDFPKIIYLIIILIFLIFFLEYLFFDFSLIGENFIRRTFSVPSYLISAYFDFMNFDSAISWSPMFGVITSEPITFVVGEWFLGYPGANANTNAFLNQLAAGGVPFYIFSIFLVSIVFAILDSSYLTKNHPALLYLGFSYAILITEQAATIAFVSSGIGLLIFIIIFSKTISINN